MLSDCHARKIQSPPDKRRRSILMCRAHNEHRDRAKTQRSPIHKLEHVDIFHKKTSYFCPGYSRPASSWRRQPTRADSLGATYKPDIFALVGPRVFQSAIARRDTMGHNDPSWWTNRPRTGGGEQNARRDVKYKNTTKTGLNVFFKRVEVQLYSNTVFLSFFFFLMSCAEPDRRQRNWAENEGELSQAAGVRNTTELTGGQLVVSNLRGYL